MGRARNRARNAAILGRGGDPSTVPPDPRSILAIRPGGLGDTLFCFPALRRLREAFPKARIAAAGNPEFLDLARLSGFVDEVRSIETLRLWSLLSDEVPIDAIAARFFGAFDLVLSWGHEGPVLERRLREAGARAVLSTPFVPPEESGLPVSRFLLDSLRALAIEGGDPAPQVFVPVTIEREARRFLEANAHPPILALHPGSGGARKNWAAERFAEVAARFVREKGGSVLLFSGYADERPREESLSALEAFSSDGTIPLVDVRDRPLPEVAALLANSSAYLGNDSGITHLAAAVGVPVVAILATRDRRFRPFGRRVTVVDGASLASIPATAVWKPLRKSVRLQSAP